MSVSSPLRNALIVGVLGLLALTLFMTGFEEGLSEYFGTIAWYYKLLAGLILAFFVGRKLI